jgi:hypothetical protein
VVAGFVRAALLLIHAPLRQIVMSSEKFLIVRQPCGCHASRSGAEKGVILIFRPSGSRRWKVLGFDLRITPDRTDSRRSRVACGAWG